MAPDCVRCCSSSVARARPKSRILTRGGPPGFGVPHPGGLIEPLFSSQTLAGFDVAVDETAVVGRFQPLGHLTADAQDLRRRQLSALLEPIVQRLALQEFHGQERDAAFFANLVDGDDVIVLMAAAALASRRKRFLTLALAPRAGRIALSATRRLSIASSAL